MHSPRWNQIISITIGGSFAVLAQSVAPEILARQNKLRADAAKVDLSIRLDRSTYMPYERIEFTIRAHNKTAFPLEIPDPVAEKAAAVDLYSPHPRWKGVYPDEFGPNTPYPRRSELDLKHGRIPKTRTLAAGEEISRTFSTNDKVSVDNPSIVPIRSAPFSLGPHRIVYTLSGSVAANFIVVPSILEAIAYVPLQGTFSYTSFPDPRLPGKAPPVITAKRGTVMAAIGAENAHWLVVSGSDRVNQSVLFGIRTGEPLTLSHGILLGHVRVAQSPLPITSISGVADPNDTITITWIDSSGKSGTVRVDKDRKVLPAK